MLEPLYQVLERLGSADAEIVSLEDLSIWPKTVRAMLERERLLSQSGLAVSVECKACFEGHVEPVETITDPEDSVPRHYIVCPLEGRILVDPNRLRQWRLNFGDLARVVGRLLGTNGTVREKDIEGVCELGSMDLAGDICEVLLARGGSFSPSLLSGLAGGMQTLVLTVGETATPLDDSWVVPLRRVINGG